MKKLYATFLIIACTLVSLPCNAQAEWKNDFSKQGEILKTVGRGNCAVTDGVFRSVDAYSCFGNPEWKNYTMSFKARAPKDAERARILTMPSITISRQKTYQKDLKVDCRMTSI